MSRRRRPRWILRLPTTLYLGVAMVVVLFTCAAILTTLFLGHKQLYDNEVRAGQYHLQSSIHASYVKRAVDTIEHLFTTATTSGYSPSEINFVRTRFQRSASTLLHELTILNSIQMEFGHPEPEESLRRLTEETDSVLSEFFVNLDHDHRLNKRYFRLLHTLELRIDQFDRFHVIAYRETNLEALRASFWRRFYSLTAIGCGVSALIIGALILLVQNARGLHQQATRESQERQQQLDALFLNAPFGLLLIDDELRCLRSNTFIAQLCDQTGELDSGIPLKDVLQSDDAELEATARRVLRTRASAFNLEMQCRFDPSRPTATPISLSLFPIDHVPGRPKLLGCILEDITERTRTAERQKLMMRELDHRVKNNLAAVLGLAQQTVAHSDSLEEFSSSFLGRIMAMARTHEALASANWEGIDLAAAADITLMSHLPSSRPRVMIEGKNMRLPSRAALPICLTLHELATNSTKYGSLSMADGKVDLTWSREDDHLDIRWDEQGGPSLQEPITPGYGMSLIKGLVCHQLAGDVSFGAEPDGYRCVIRIPLSESEEDAPISPLSHM